MAVPGVIHEFLINRGFDEGSPITEPSAGKNPIKSLPVPAESSVEPGQLGMVLNTPTSPEPGGTRRPGAALTPCAEGSGSYSATRVRTTEKDGI